MGPSSFLLSLFLPPTSDGGGTVDHTSYVMDKNAGLYRSLYGSVWFGLVAYHNSDLTVLKCLNLARCVVISMSVPYRG